MAKVTILEGFTMARRRRRRSGSGSRLARAARHCKGRTKGKFRKCMKKQLRKKGRR